VRRSKLTVPRVISLILRSESPSFRYCNGLLMAAQTRGLTVLVLLRMHLLVLVVESVVLLRDSDGVREWEMATTSEEKEQTPAMAYLLLPHNTNTLFSLLPMDSFNFQTQHSCTSFYLFSHNKFRLNWLGPHGVSNVNHIFILLKNIIDVVVYNFLMKLKSNFFYVLMCWIHRSQERENYFKLLIKCHKSLVSIFFFI